MRQDEKVLVLLMWAVLMFMGAWSAIQVATDIQINKDTLEVLNTMNAKTYAATEEMVEEATVEEVTAEYIGAYKVTHYCACPKCTNGSGVTASGTVPREGRTCAAEGLPIGTHLLIVATGEILTVEDRFGDPSKTDRIDIYVADHERAVQLGVYDSEIFIINY